MDWINSGTEANFLRKNGMLPNIFSDGEESTKEVEQDREEDGPAGI